jgi:uncharacterized protein (TIRG00374 family)
MAALLSPRVLRRGLQLFALVSLLGVAALLVYTGAWKPTLEALTEVRLLWLLVALALASSDWLGGGIRLWLLSRHVHRKPRFWGMVTAGGLTAWAGYLTPSSAGSGPMQIYAMKRSGVPLPVAMIVALISFFTTVVFFAIAGPLAIVFGAGRSLRAHGVPLLNISLYDVFNASAATFGAVGAVMILMIVFPGATRRLFHVSIGWLGRHRGERIAKRVEGLRADVDRMHDALVAYFRGSGIVATSVGVLTSALAHANRLLAGYVAMRAIGLQAQFVDVLVVQVVIAFLLYFAPTPGGAGAAEALSAALMSVYVPQQLLPAYTIIWRFTASYATVAFGSYVFYKLLRWRLEEAEAQALAEVVPA